MHACMYVCRVSPSLGGRGHRRARGPWWRPAGSPTLADPSSRAHIAHRIVVQYKTAPCLAAGPARSLRETTVVCTSLRVGARRERALAAGPRPPERRVEAAILGAHPLLPRPRTKPECLTTRGPLVTRQDARARVAEPDSPSSRARVDPAGRAAPEETRAHAHAHIYIYTHTGFREFGIRRAER